jgi:methylase of polypeptide subunit release factors
MARRRRERLHTLQLCENAYPTRMLQCLDAAESKEFRDFFRESGYTTRELMSRFRSLEIPALHLLKLYLMGVPLEPSRLNLLLRWFWIGSEVETGAAREFIPERVLSLFLKAGVLTEAGGCLVSSVRISPFGEFLILSDHAVSKKGPLRADTILWPNPTTLLSSHLAIQAPVGRTLDLGTGNGVLALEAASHSGTVVATDLNARAREFCVFNAALNGVSNVEFREGNAFEPVRGERFDLILANPPFFVTPSVRRVYSDNSMELDGFCRTLVRQAPAHLNENGYCQMLVEWVQVKGQPWRERLTEWFEGSGCDVWVMGSYKKSAADYAMIRVMEDRDEIVNPADQAAMSTQWRAYFEGNQVDSIFGGVLVLRRRQGRNWIRLEELPAIPTRPFGEFLRRVFENHDYLERSSDEELLASRPALPASARLQKQFANSPEGWKLTSVDLQLGEGLPYSISLQPQVADFMASCNGKQTLGEIAHQMAAALSVDPAMVRRETCGIIRQMADRGMVLM